MTSCTKTKTHPRTKFQNYVMQTVEQEGKARGQTDESTRRQRRRICTYVADRTINWKLSLKQAMSTGKESIQIDSIIDAR